MYFSQEKEAKNEEKYSKSIELKTVNNIEKLVILSILT